MSLPKPVDMFDRDWEWDQLTRFVMDDSPGARLGIVSGRRRQGKTFLLQSVCEAIDGFYFAATEALPKAEALRQFGQAMADYTGAAGSLTFVDWAQAIDALMRLGTERRVPVVLDEFPYLVGDAKELPSTIQRALAPRSALRQETRARFLLCGSSISFMGGLLSGGAPLRGRAGLELIVPTFNFRTAAEFWGIADRRLAALMYFVLGGTPAYRTVYLSHAKPPQPSTFDAWIADHVLNPASPLFREVRALLSEEPNIRDTGLYHTVLAAVAEGNATRGGIANRIGRKSEDISHHLNVLQDAGLLVAEPDAFRANRTQYRITEPLVRFYHAIMRPQWTQLERVRPGRTEQIWAASHSRFHSNVAGPVFEYLCRLWSEDMASEETFGAPVVRALSGTVYDARGRQSYDVDVAAFDADRKLVAIGEVKWGDVMGMGHLDRLEAIAAVLAERDQRPGVLALFSGTGFMPALRDAAARSRGRIQLIDLERLYAGG
jgi:AAA+ ATPase superfamily predicted ATPase